MVRAFGRHAHAVRGFVMDIAVELPDDRSPALGFGLVVGGQVQGEKDWHVAPDLRCRTAKSPPRMDVLVARPPIYEAPGASGVAGPTGGGRRRQGSSAGSPESKVLLRRLKAVLDAEIEMVRDGPRRRQEGFTSSDAQVAAINSMIALLRDARDTSSKNEMSYKMSEVFHRARTVAQAADIATRR